MRRTLRRSRNDSSEARCSKAGQICLWAGPPSGLGISGRGMLCRPRNDKRRGGFFSSGVRHSVVTGMIRWEKKGCGRANQLSKLEINWDDLCLSKGGTRPWNDLAGTRSA